MLSVKYSKSFYSTISNLILKQMNVIDITKQSDIGKLAKEAASILLDDGVIALPTDTLYGLAALAQSEKGIKDIYSIKRRSPLKPLAISVCEVDDVYLWGKVTISRSLLECLLPGPVTLVFECTAELNKCLNPDTNLVGIRIPDHDFIRSVIKECHSPLALTSANVNSEQSPLSVNEFKGLWDKLEKVYDCGELGGQSLCRKGSTIVDLSVVDHFKIIRKGSACSHTIGILKKFGLSRREVREAVIRTNLLDKLKESVQSLIQGPGGSGIPRLSSGSHKGPTLGHTENTNVLCSVLEGIFIHGLKDSLGDKLSSMFLGDIDRMPVPNFWPVIMVISHRDLMEQVSSLTFIMNDVGKSRAWMRLALNSSQLISYLSVLASDERTLKDYYKPTALLRDLEKCDIILRVLNPLNGLNFDLSTNAAILNTWNQTPLILSGTWIPANYKQTIGPVMSATDVASTFQDYDDRESLEVPQTPLSDQMFDFIINGTPETDFIDNKDTPCEPITNEASVEDGSRCSPLNGSPVTDAAVSRSGSASPVSSDDINEPSDKEVTEIDCSINQNETCSDKEEKEVCLAVQKPRDPFEGSDTESLTRSTSLFNDTNEYRNLLSNYDFSDQSEKLPDFLKATNSPSPKSLESFEETEPVQSNQLMESDESDFEILTAPTDSLEKELAEHLPLLTELQNEVGLQTQGYKCHKGSCHAPIGMIYGKPRLCHYDGHYYCYECHQGEESVIPAKIIHNWEFKPFSVCSVHKHFLDNILMKPLINIRVMCPELYKHFDNLSELKSLRTQLHFIQAYLFTCQQRVSTFTGIGTQQSTDGSQPIAAQELLQLLWPKEHLYEHVHLYSIHDLQQVQNGSLVPLVKQAVSKGRVHIMRCPLCCPRGFICEICKEKTIIYPFQLLETHTCTKCNGVFHKCCISRQARCPKCSRMRFWKLVKLEPLDTL